MFVDKNAIIINGVSMGQYILEAKFEYHKLWASDSGRNLAGEQTGTLIGIFPKIVLQFKKLTPTELEIITPIIDSAVQTVTYYDPTKQTFVTMQTYTGDYEIVNRDIVDDDVKNQSFNCSFIAVRKRG